MKNENVLTVRKIMSPGQRRELAHSIEKVLPADMLADVAQKWIGDGASLRKIIHDTLTLHVTTGDPILDWEILYETCFNLYVDFTRLHIPEKKKGFDRLVIIPKGISLNHVYEACEKLFRCYDYAEDLKGLLEGKNEREPTQHYAIWIRDRSKADVENGSIPACDVKKRRGASMTLLERMLLEMKYFTETGEHLDLDYSSTLCAGSIIYDDQAPVVRWDETQLDITTTMRGSSGPEMCARSVIA